MRPEDATRGLLWAPLSSMRFTGIDPVAGELFCEEVAERIGAWASAFRQRMLLLDGPNGPTIKSEPSLEMAVSV